MDSAAIRKKLHPFIETADNKLIKALYTILESDINRMPSYTQEEIDRLHKRAEKYLNGQGKTYSVEESHAHIRQQKQP